MRIGFDSKRAFMNASGLGNYSRTLMLSLLRNFPENDYVAFTPGIEKNLGRELIDTRKLTMVFPPKMMQGFLSSWWRSSLMSQDTRAQSLDIFHGLSNELPSGLPSSTKKIVTIHDLIFLRHPEWYPFFDRNIYYRKFRKACEQADAIIAVSGQTKKDVHYYFNVAEEKVKVIYQSCNERFFTKITDDALVNFRKRNNMPEKYVLFVGTVEERKNLLTLVKAMKKVPGISLVVIGRKKKYFEKVQAYIRLAGLQSRIIFPENITSEELPLLYQGAAVFVYPSLYEGFGIPVIEALASAIPVIASRTAALPEAGGPSSLYFNPEDADELAEKIMTVLNDSQLRSKMIGDGKEYIRRFNQTDLASEMMGLYTNILK
jgi:glycosyltransferase involved in cell wall biosynthesis